MVLNANESLKRNSAYAHAHTHTHTHIHAHTHVIDSSVETKVKY